MLKQQQQGGAYSSAYASRCITNGELEGVGCTTLSDRNSSQLVPLNDLTKLVTGTEILVDWVGRSTDINFSLYPTITFYSDSSCTNVIANYYEQEASYYVNNSFTITVPDDYNTFYTEFSIQPNDGTYNVIYIAAGTDSYTKAESAYSYLSELSYNSSTAYDLDTLVSNLQSIMESTPNYGNTTVSAGTLLQQLIGRCAISLPYLVIYTGVYT